MVSTSAASSVAGKKRIQKNWRDFFMVEKFIIAEWKNKFVRFLTV
jgi:hypothetical protein